MIGENKVKKKALKSRMVQKSLISSVMVKRRLDEDYARFSNADTVIGLKQSAPEWLPSHTNDVEHGLAKGMNQSYVL